MAEEDDMLKDFDFAVQHIGEIANKVKDVVNFINPYCEGNTTHCNSKEVDNTMKKTNERGNSDWVSMDDMIGMEVGESEEQPGEFQVGDRVIWIEPDKGYPSDGWTVENVSPGKHPSGDDLYIISRGKSSVMNIRRSELRPATMMNETNDILSAEEFLDKVLDDAEDTNDVCEVYDGTVLEDNEVVLNVNVYKDDVEDLDVKEEFKTMPRKYGWEYEGWEYSSDITGDDNTEILVYFKKSAMGLKIGDRVQDSESKGRGVVVDVNGTRVKVSWDNGNSTWEQATSNEIELMQEGGESEPMKQKVNEASVVVDANDVWDVLDLLDDEVANKKLTDLINSHVRTEDEIMDAVDSYVERYWSGRITKQGLVQIFTKYMYAIVESLGLDVEKYKETGEFVDPEKPVALEGSDDNQKPDEIKDGEKKYKQDGETKTLDFGENKKPVCEMTIEQEVTDPWKLLELLWGQGKENFEELLRSNLFSDDRVMDTLEQFEVKNLTNLNDLLAYDFEYVLEALGCDTDAWTQRLEIQKA